MIKDTPKNGPIFWCFYYPVWIKKKIKKNTKLKKMCSCENTSVFFDKVSNSQGQIGTFKQKNVL